MRPSLPRQTHCAFSYLFRVESAPFAWSPNYTESLQVSWPAASTSTRGGSLTRNTVQSVGMSWRTLAVVGSGMALLNLGTLLGFIGLSYTSPASASKLHAKLVWMCSDMRSPQ